MSGAVRAGLYTPVSMVILRRIAAKTRNPKLVMAYLALARHGDGREIADYPPHTLTGAGANKVKQVVAVAERTASLLVNSLLNQGYISRAPEAARQVKSRLTYQLHPEGDLVDIPHALIDGLEVAGHQTPGIRRLWALDCTSDEVLNALMLLLEVYAATDMDKWGGASPALIRRDWETDATVPADGEAFRWIARALNDKTQIQCMTPAMAHTGLTWTNGKNPAQDERLRNTFFRSWKLLRECGLVYETVYVLNGDEPVVPIRVNDYHGDADRDNEFTRDPSFLKIAEGLGFYTPANNEINDPEGAWFYWHHDPTSEGLSIRGIYRPRFRAANAATGKGITRDREAAERLLEVVDAALMAG